jgi:heme-degrading monooxygenase HmoA
MHIIVWEFTVREGRLQEFVSAYDAKGDWAKLFRRAQGYLGTELLRSSDEANTFLTIDRWESADCFEIFQARFGAEYKRLDAECENYTLSERKVGVFSVA